jgi:serine protease Do
MSRLLAIALLLAPVCLQAQETEKAVSRKAKETLEARQEDPGGCVREQLATDGKVPRGRIGVRLQGINAGIAESFGLDRPRGALVSYVEPGQPAHKAGIRPGDIVLRVGGRPVENAATLCSMVAAIKPGTRTEFEVWSDRKLRKVAVQTPTD